jgi:serine/threonine protein kinase
MLVYEFMVNGNLRDHLTPTEEMNFATRIHIALGTARGILYLHTEADPPIFHRDIKANNILLDQNYNAKVADFGLSKLAPEPNVDDATPEHVSTTVKGTPGYMDPLYYMTNRFTDKSDVYSFGVVLLELITGMMPISHGKYILREVREALAADKISSIIDPCMGNSYPPDGLDRLLKLALSCCSQEYEERPLMIDLTRELEDIWRLTAASYPMLHKMDSDISSHNFGTTGQSSQTSGPYSVLDVEAKDGTGKFSSISDPHVWPR